MALVSLHTGLRTTPGMRLATAALGLPLRPSPPGVRESARPRPRGAPPTRRRRAAAASPEGTQATPRRAAALQAAALAACFLTRTCELAVIRGSNGLRCESRRPHRRDER